MGESNGWVRGSESAFKALVSDLVQRGIYPSHRLLVTGMGRAEGRYPFGLSKAQGRWRREVVEEAGYDWDSSKRARALIARG